MPAIKKKALCREAKGEPQAGFIRLRPMYGHDYHFHIRIKCPPGRQRMREASPEPSTSEGCKPADLAYWFQGFGYPPESRRKSRPKPKTPDDPWRNCLPACRQVLAAPDAQAVADQRADFTRPQYALRSGSSRRIIFGEDGDPAFSA